MKNNNFYYLNFFLGGEEFKKHHLIRMNKLGQLPELLLTWFPFSDDWSLQVVNNSTIMEELELAEVLQEEGQTVIVVQGQEGEVIYPGLN